MSDPISKYARLVDLLFEKTKLAKVPWDYDSTRRELAIWNGDVLLNMTRSQDENFEDVYKCALFNKSGTLIESFDDTTLNRVAIKPGDENYYEKMKEIFNLAVRQATGADKALDEFISAVEKDRFNSPF